MITCDMQGGLGNILFQVATTLSLAKNNNDEAYFDLTQNINCVTQHFNNLSKYKSNVFSNLNDKPRIVHKNHYNEPHFHYKEIPYKEDLFIHGYFQSEKYFSNHREYITSILSPPSDIKEYLSKKYNNILLADTVSLHCRRGDYLKYSKQHHIHDLTYFSEALKPFNGKKVVVFSDDIQWCKDNIKVSNIEFIQGEEDYMDLYLMSMCKNNIICNSTFSWWGAWLNNNPNKKIIAPKTWFGPMHQHSVKDIYPESWTIINP